MYKGPLLRSREYTWLSNILLDHILSEYWRICLPWSLASYPSKDGDLRFFLSLESHTLFKFWLMVFLVGPAGHLQPGSWWSGSSSCLRTWGHCTTTQPVPQGFFLGSNYKMRIGVRWTSWHGQTCRKTQHSWSYSSGYRVYLVKILTRNYSKKLESACC